MKGRLVDNLVGLQISVHTQVDQDTGTTSIESGCVHEIGNRQCQANHATNRDKPPASLQGPNDVPKSDRRTRAQCIGPLGLRGNIVSPSTHYAISTQSENKHAGSKPSRCFSSPAHLWVQFRFVFGFEPSKFTIARNNGPFNICVSNDLRAKLLATIKG